MISIPALRRRNFIAETLIQRGINMEENIRENKMGTMPIGKLLANMAGPVMISMLFQDRKSVV